MTQTIAVPVFTLLIVSLLTGCGADSGFKAQNLDSKGSIGGSPNNGFDSGDESPQKDPLPNIDFKAQHTGANSSKLAAIIDTTEESLVLYLPLSSFFSLGEIQGESPKLPGLTFESQFNADGSSSLALNVPLKYLVSDMDWLAPARLPNGDGLPAIPEGELPSVNFPLLEGGDLDLHVYLGYGAVAFYVTSPFDPVVRLQVGIRDQQRSKVVGYFATVPEKLGYQGGFFMSMILPEELTIALDDHFKIE